MPLRTSASAWVESRQRISVRREKIATELDGGGEMRSPQLVENKATVCGILGKEKGLRECLSPLYWWWGRTPSQFKFSQRLRAIAGSCENLPKFLIRQASYQDNLPVVSLPVEWLRTRVKLRVWELNPRSVCLGSPASTAGFVIPVLDIVRNMYILIGQGVCRAQSIHRY